MAGVPTEFQTETFPIRNMKRYHCGKALDYLKMPENET
jgi:hypothetical protein